VPTTRRIHIQPSADAQVPQALLAQGMGDIQRELKLPLAFPPEVEAAAAQAALHPRLPELDRSDIPLLTIDPPESMDLDQAMYVERTEGGHRVYYAIADVAAFVTAGDPVDIEANRRGETLYGADAKIPLHPKVLSEAAASLLPGQLRPALLWTIELDKAGESIAVDVRRARVKSRAKLDYAGVQQRIDGGTAEPMWTVLREIGELRKQRELARGGVSLPLPEQEISTEGGRWTLAFRARMAVEDWNEQISLLTGMAAAQLMVQAKVGLLRTLPDPDPLAIQRLRITAKVLGIVWPPELSYPDERCPCRDADGMHLCAARGRLCSVQRIAARTPDAFGARRGIHPCDRAAAPAGRSLHRRGLRGPVREPAGARLGAGRIAGAARHDAGIGPPRPAV
jgi:exoribonuclease R